jgi:hypothetical protein
MKLLEDAKRELTMDNMAPILSVLLCHFLPVTNARSDSIQIHEDAMVIGSFILM